MKTWTYHNISARLSTPSADDAADMLEPCDARDLTLVEFFVGDESVGEVIYSTPRGEENAHFPRQVKSAMVRYSN